MAEEIGMSVFSVAVESMMKKVLCHLRYVFSFSRIVKELELKNQELKRRHVLVQHDVEQAERDAQTIEEEVATWQGEVKTITAEVQMLEEDIVQKKSCFNGMCPNLFYRYRFGKQAAKKTAAMASILDKGNFSRVSYRPVANLPGIDQFDATDDFLPSKSARAAFGRIMEELKDDKKKIIALWGMGGVGKTTLAVEVGKKAKELKLFDEVVMGVVSQTPNVERIQGQIADMLGLHFQDGNSSLGKAKQLRLRLEKSEKKILIVLDDLWAKLNLAEVGIPSSDDCNHLKILITTRQLQVCNSMGSEANIALDTLTPAEAWDLFKRSAGVSDDKPSLNDVAKSVASECKGLPLAIVTVAGALKGKSLEDWEVALDRLKGSRFVNIPDVDKDVYKCLRLSYEYLQSEEYKLCFLLCSLFPEDDGIEVEVLVRTLIGLGCCEDVGGSIDKARKQVHVMIRGLQACNLLLSSRLVYGEWCVKMHDIVRDVALWIASEGESDNIFLGKAGMGLEEWPNPRKVNYDNLVAVSLIKNKILQHPNALLCSRLKLLFLDENGCYNFPNEFFAGMEALQVLSLAGDAPFLSLPESIQKLTNLQTLHLQGLQLKDISGLGKLKGLEILSLRSSKIEELPDAFGELNGLRILDLTYCRRLGKIPANLLRKLSKLEELYMSGCRYNFWEPNSNAILDELMSLSRLCILCLAIGKAEYLPVNFYFPKHLVRYHIQIGQFEHWLVTHHTYPTSKTLSLDNIDASRVISACKELFPKVNSIGCSRLKEGISNMMPMVDQSGLNDLTELQLRACHYMECLVDTTYGWTPTSVFSNLAELKLLALRELTRLWKGPTEAISLVNLTQVRVDSCPKLTHMFSVSVARSMIHLRILKVIKCNELKHFIFANGDESKEIQAINVNGANITFFPELKELIFTELPSLTFSRGHYISASSLEVLSVRHCPNIGTHFIEEGLRSHAKNLRKLAVPGVNGCRLSAIVVEQLMLGSTTGLQELEVEDCGGLQDKRLIPGLLKVERFLSIKNCNGVEEILQVQEGQFTNVSWEGLTLKDLPDLTCMWRGPSHNLTFHNLQGLSVKGCNGLKNHLLTTSIARTLSHLCELDVADCKELEHIFGEEEGDDDKTICRDKKTIKIVLPRLYRLTLTNLPSLMSFCPSTYQFLFMSIYITVRNCPKNTTGFFQLSDKVVARGESLCSVQNRGKCNDITRPADVPLYKEEDAAESLDANIVGPLE